MRQKLSENVANRKGEHAFGIIHSLGFGKMNTVMNTDRHVLEENAAMLSMRSKVLSEYGSSLNLSRWGITQEMHDAIGSLDDVQVTRAADCTVPLFGFTSLDDVVIAAIQAKEPSSLLATATSPLDRVIEEENFSLLLARWASSRESPIYAKTILGLSDQMVEALENASLADLKSASRRGIRLAAIRVTPKYFLHAGRHVSLQRSQRTSLAICSSVTRIQWG